MLRLWAVIKGDIRFQWKYGFYYIYVILVILYIAILSMLQGKVKEIAAFSMVYSDPAAMGMFFMGAIVLLEKSERVLNTIAVSPVTPTEYILGKMCSIGMIAMAAGGVILAAGDCKTVVLSLTGILLASFLFTLFGLMVGSRIQNLTQYIVATLPFEILGFVPPVAWMIGWQQENQWMLLHPGCAMISMIAGKSEFLPLAVISSSLWIVLVFMVTKRMITRMFQSVGGA